MKKEIIIYHPTVTQKNKSTSITYKFKYRHKIRRFTNQFLSKIENPYLGIEGIVALFVPHAILTGAVIKSKIPVDQTFYDNLQNLVPVFQKWHPDRKNLKLRINLPTITRELKPSRKTISTCTMGVDSFYTLYSKMDELDSVIFCIGFDMAAHEKKLIKQTVQNLRKVCALYNKTLILCRSNQRSQFDEKIKGFKLGPYQHGPGLFNVVYALSNDYSKLYLPSTHQASEDSKWGSSFSLDRHYSSTNFVIEHNGDLNRSEKTKYICQKDPRCLEYLRVCHRNPNMIYNCSKCEKCLRTLSAIKAHGFLDQAVTFNRKVNLEKYWKMKMGKGYEIFRDEIQDFIDSTKK